MNFRKVICKYTGFWHKWSDWELSPIRGDRMVRHCKNCGWGEEKPS